MIILDAFNILHAGPILGIGRISLSRLKEWIGESRYASDHVVLVLDGAGGGGGSRTLQEPLEAGLALESRASGISEVYAGRGVGSDADTVIEALLEREEVMGRGRKAVVVSSDKRVRAAAAGARARSITSEDFLQRLIDDLRKVAKRLDGDTGGRPEFATDAGSDAGRTDYWMRRFGLTDEPGSKVKDGAEPEAGRGVERAADPTPEEIASIDMRRVLDGSIAPKPPISDQSKDGESNDERRRGDRRRPG